MLPFNRSDELLAAIDVIRRTGQRRIGDDVDGERRDVFGADDTPDGKRCPQFAATLLESIAEEGCRQRSVYEARRDEIDAHWRKFERERRRERRQGGGGRRDNPQAATDPAPAGATHEQQRAPR